MSTQEDLEPTWNPSGKMSRAVHPWSGAILASHRVTQQPTWTLWAGNQGTIEMFTYRGDVYGCHQRQGYGQDFQIKEYSDGFYYRYAGAYDFSEAFAPQRDDGLFGPYPGDRYLYDAQGAKKGYMDHDQNVYTYEEATNKYYGDDGVEYIVPSDGYAYYLHNGAYYARGDDTKPYTLHDGELVAEVDF